MRPTMFQTREQLTDYLNEPRIKCLECGRRLKKLGVHLRAIHGMEPDDYREKYGIPYGVGLACPELRDLIRDQVGARTDPLRMKELQQLSAAKQALVPHRRMNAAPVIQATDRSTTDKMHAAMLKNLRERGPSETKIAAALKNLTKATERIRRDGPTAKQSAASRAVGKTWGKLSIDRMLESQGKKRLSVSPGTLTMILGERKAGASLAELSRKYGIAWSSMQRLCSAGPPRLTGSWIEEIEGNGSN